MRIHFFAAPFCCFHLVQGSRFKVQGSRFKVQGSGFRVQGSGVALVACRLLIACESGGAGSTGSEGSEGSTGAVRRIKIRSAAEY